MTGAQNIHDVSHAFTLKNRWLTSAILNGEKSVENRSQAWKPGWYAVHTGVSKEDPNSWAEEHVRMNVRSPARMASIAEDVKADRVPKGCIAGVCRIAHALPVDSLATETGWAVGPVCMVIAETLWLRTPIDHKGQLGTWPLSDMARARLASQVGACTIEAHGHDVAYPADPNALEKMRANNRLMRQKRKAGGQDFDGADSKRLAR